MTAKEYLQQYQTTKHKIERLTWTIKELKSMAEGTPYVMDGMPHGDGLKSPMETYMCDALDKENDLAVLIDDAQDLLLDVENTIEKVNDPILSDLLFFRYIQGLQWSGDKIYYNKTKSPYIVDKLGYTRQQVHNLHKKALDKVQKIIDEN